MSILPDEAVDTLEQLRLEFEELRTSGDRDDKKRLKEIPREVCETVRAMAISSLNDFHEALTVADDVLNEFVDAIYHSHSWDFRDFLPSFADTGEDGPAPLLKDTEAGELHFMGEYHIISLTFGSVLHLLLIKVRSYADVVRVASLCS